eukprot:3190374-Lingulodinium_polyedra.AAC.1
MEHYLSNAPSRYPKHLDPHMSGKSMAFAGGRVRHTSVNCFTSTLAVRSPAYYPANSPTSPK